MTVKDLIESGLLEAYVAGQVSPSERSQVERIAAEHPEVKAELYDIEIAIEKMAMAVSVMPPPGLKYRIMDQVAEESGTLTKDAPTKASVNARWPYVAAVLLGLFAAYLYADLGKQKQQYELQRLQKEDLQQQLNDCTVKSEPIAALLQHESTLITILKKQDLQAVFYYNNTTKQTVVESALAVPSNRKYYQFWVIQDGKAVSLGMAKPQGNKYYMLLPYLERVEKFAISLEDKPEGNLQPTEVLVIGDVGKG